MTEPNKTFKRFLQSRGITIPLSENLQTWFKGSHMVNAAGDPIIYYHTTSEKFDIFDPTKQSKTAIWGPGIYLTTDKNESWNKGSEKIVLELYAKVLNPIYLTGADTHALDIISTKLNRPGLEAIPFISLEKRYGSTTEGLWACGFDGIIHYGPSDKIHLIVKDSNQVKVISNKDFSDSPNIYK